MAAPGTPQHMRGEKKGKEKKAIPMPIHGHKHGKDSLGHTHPPNTELHHTH